MLLVGANTALQAEDSYTFIVRTCQATIDVRFRTPALGRGIYFQKLCRLNEQDLVSHQTHIGDGFLPVK